MFSAAVGGEEAEAEFEEDGVVWLGLECVKRGDAVADRLTDVVLCELCDAMEKVVERHSQGENC